LSRIHGKALLATTLCMLAGGASHAQSQPPSAAKPQLKLVVILSRHGVRSPTWTQSRLDSYSVQPWPSWNVPPGNLTVQGHRLLTRFGSFDRASLAANGLLAPAGCADAASTYIWADTDQRTIESGHALAEGLFPGCTLPLHGLPEGQNDPLFHPAADGVRPTEAAAAFAELSARVKQPADPQLAEFVAELRHLLLGCAPRSSSCVPQRTPEAQLSTEPLAALRGKGDHMVDLAGPLPFASSFAEDLLLEYADGMPMAQVGWGKVDEADIGRLLALHTGDFELLHRTPAIAKVEASNMLAHITHTLQQGVERKPVDGAVGGISTKVVLLVGHDTNIAAVASLLGAHWQLDGRADDTPPGTEMAFELWQDAHGGYAVRVTAAMQTLRQLRDGSELTVAAPPAHQALSLPGCNAAKPCEWRQFQRIVNAAINVNDVVPMKTQ